MEYKMISNGIRIFLVLMLSVLSYAQEKNPSYKITAKVVKKIKLSNKPSKYKISRHPFSVFGRIIMDKNGNILGLNDHDREKTLWVNGDTTGEAYRIVQPIANKNFFFIFDTSGGYSEKAGFYNFDTKTYKKFPGIFSGLEDIDADGLPEICTLEEVSDGKYKGTCYTIINKDTKPSMGILAQNFQPKAEYRDGFEPMYGSDFINIPTFKYLKNDHLIIFKKRKTVRTGRRKGEKAYENYFNKWNKGGVQIKNTIRRSNSSYRKSAEYYIKNNFPLSEADEIKIASVWDKYGTCFNFNSEKIKKRYNWYKLPNLLVCNRGKGYIKLSHNRLAIFDFDKTNDAPDIYQTTILGAPTVLLSSYTKYLIVYNLKTKIPQLYFWKDILGFKPDFVKYFDGKKLVVIKGRKVIIYNTNFAYSSVQKEQW